VRANAAAPGVFSNASLSAVHAKTARCLRILCIWFLLLPGKPWELAVQLRQQHGQEQQQQQRIILQSLTFGSLQW
jgi:hypothetical protein